MELTEGTLLGGRVRYRQPRTGHRTGLEPVLLAAAIPARPGEHVLEGGTGAGAGLLCLNARVPGVRGLGIELDEETAALARQNLAASGGACDVRTADLLLIEGLSEFDHAFANPPWHDPAGTPSPVARRALARHVRGDGVLGWTTALCAAVREGGTVTLILPASLAGGGLRALEDAGCGAAVLWPFWPKTGRDARLVLVQGRRGRRTPGRIAAGLVLHEEDGRFTPAAEAVLRYAAALDLASADRSSRDAGRLMP